MQHNPHSTTASTADWLASGGATGQLIREKDWSQTPLGPIDGWPQSLRTTVSICLASNFPINIIWGPQRVQIYNDGYRPICGDKHPFSMGQDYKECWFSAWEAIGEPFENASIGQTDFLVNQRMFLDRNGYLEETFFTFSLSPIRDETGGIGGLFHPVNETTQEMVGERRLKVLRDLADQTADAKTVKDVCELAGQSIERQTLDVPFALFYLLDATGKQARLVTSTGLSAGSPACPDDINLDTPAETGWPLNEVFHTRKIAVVDDLIHRFGPLKAGPYDESPNTALVLPINLSGLDQPFGFLVVGVSSRRPLDDAYHTFYVMLQASVTNALTNARAYEQERKRAEALAEIDRAKTAFFSNVSHEFRTPLTLMLGPLEDTLADSSLPAPIHERLTVAHRNSQRLLKLVNSLLDFSRIEAGRVEAVFEPVDLAAFTADLASVFRSAIERAGMQLIVDCPPLPEPVYIDREMWEKIVFNLLSNAFKFTFEGSITVSLRSVDAMVELSVSDTGTGIPASELSSLFERFHRVKGARGRSFEGSGIGLALVQELVRLHVGSVGVQSEVERGSTFTVTLPLGKAHLPADRISGRRVLVSTEIRGDAYLEEALRWLPQAETDSPPLVNDKRNSTGREQPQPDTSTASARVLLVDDNTDMREYVRQLLAPHYEVITATDGEAALALSSKQAFDLVLTDVMMPKLDGFGLLKALRADERTRTIPIILLSARAGEESRVEGMEAGADDYLIKPFSARELLARVEAHLNLQRQRRQAEQAVREQTAQFETLLNEAPLGVFLLDADFHIRQANPMARLILEPASDLIGCEVEAVIRQRWPHQQADELVRLLHHTLESGESTSIPEPPEARSQPGQSQYYEWQLNRIPLPDSRQGVVCYILDISNQVVARQAVTESEANYRLLFNSIDEGFCLVEVRFDEEDRAADYRFLEVNPAFEQQTGIKKATGQWMRQVAPLHEQYWFDNYGAVARTGVDRRFEAYAHALNCWYDVYAFRVGQAGDNKVAILFNDITPRKQAEQSLTESEARYRTLSAELEEQVQQRTHQLQTSVQDLQRSNENLAQFAYVASHDLQEPLRKIQQFGDLLKSQYSAELDQGLAYLERMQSAANRMSVLIKDLLSYSRISTGQETTEPVSLTEVVERVLSDLDLVISETGARVTVDTLPTVVGEASQLGQLFGNLLSNALKFRKPNQLAVIRVSTESIPTSELPPSVAPTRMAAAYHRINVSDNGIGFDDKYVDRIFQVFQRLHNKTEFAGTGIGLAICQKVAANHGGAITASSQPGEGATFSVYLPE